MINGLLGCQVFLSLSFYSLIRCLFRSLPFVQSTQREILCFANSLYVHFILANSKIMALHKNIRPHHTRLLSYFSVELLNLFQKFLKWQPKSFGFFRRGMRQSDSGRDDYVLLSYLETHLLIQRRT